MATKKKVVVKGKEVKFDREKPRALCMKVRCSNSFHNQYGYDIAGGDKCNTVYLKIMENEDNPTPMDLKTTHLVCPICKSDKWEKLTDWTLSKDKLRVIVTPVDPI